MLGPDPFRVCMFCGSNTGADPAFAETAARFGSALAHRGIGLVYGGGRVGLMGIAADAALAAGGEVIGVITERLVRAEVAHDELTDLRVVETMHARKALMSELADGFVVMPGGFGTVDESAEMLTWNQLGLVAKPVVFLDVGDFWAPWFQWVDHAVTSGFVRDSHRLLVQRARSVDEAIAMVTSPPPAVGHKWLDRDPTPPPGVPHRSPT